MEERELGLKFCPKNTLSMATSKVERKMATAFTSGQTAQATKATGWTARLLALGFTNGPMDECLLASGSTAKREDLEFTIGRTVDVMKDFLRKISDKAMAH